jgi:hypothetical protein
LGSGTPEVSISTQYDTIKNTYTVTVTQQSKHFFPLSFALLDDAGNELEKGVLTIKDNSHQKMQLHLWYLHPLSKITIAFGHCPI